MTKLVIRRINPLSLGKVLAIIDGFMGLLGGALVTLLSVLGAGIGAAVGEHEALLGLVFGVGAIIVLPIVYAVVGFLVGLLIGALYNLAAGWVGGLEIETG